MVKKPEGRVDKQGIRVRVVSAQAHNPSEGSKLETILGMVQLGCAVIPVAPYEKKAAIKNWPNEASKDAKTIRDYFSNNPTANYGILTGAQSGIIVVDLDGVEGVRNWRRLEKLNGPSAPTLTVASPNGIHLYYRAPKHRVPNSTSKIAESIDIKGDGGYVVGPASETLDGVYRFAPGLGPNEVEIADAPAWLLEMLAQSPAPAGENVKPPKIPEEHHERALKYADAARQRELERLGKAPKHQRNNTLNICAFKLGQFLPHGLLDRKSVANQLAQVASRIGLDPQEIRPTIESGLIAGCPASAAPSVLKGTCSAGRCAAIPRKSLDDMTERLAKLGETDTDNAQRFATRVGRRSDFYARQGLAGFRRYSL